MSSSRTYLGVLAITGSLLSGAPVLLGASLGNPTFNQVDTASPLTNSYYFISTERGGPIDKDIVQEDNTGSDDSQAPMEPTMSLNEPIVDKDHENGRQGYK